MPNSSTSKQSRTTLLSAWGRLCFPLGRVTNRKKRHIPGYLPRRSPAAPEATLCSRN
jgi:hypothetical protein